MTLADSSSAESCPHAGSDNDVEETTTHTNSSAKHDKWPHTCALSSWVPPITPQAPCTFSLPDEEGILPDVDHPTSTPPPKGYREKGRLSKLSLSGKECDGGDKVSQDTTTPVPAQHLPGGGGGQPSRHRGGDFSEGRTEKFARNDSLPLMDGHTEEGIPRDLISGLPSELALGCLARAPRYCQGVMQGVCTSWRKVLQKRDVLEIRKKLNITEEWLYALCEVPEEGLWRCYDPKRARWFDLPPMPGANATRVLSNFGCAVLPDGRLMVIGGCYILRPPDGSQTVLESHATADIRTFDPLRNLWEEGPKLLEARRAFGHGVINDKVYVFGGLGEDGKLLVTGEAFDPATATWQPIAPLEKGRYLSAAAVLGGKLYAINGRVETGPEDRNQWTEDTSAEVYDPASDTWTLIPDMWYRRDLPGPACALKGKLHVIDCEDDCKLKLYHDETNTWSDVDQLPVEDNTKHSGARMAALDNEIYVIGGTLYYPDGDINRYRKLNTVLVYNQEIDPTWRELPDMGKSRGAVWGCAVIAM